MRDHHSVLNHGWNCKLFMFQAGTVGSLGLICNGCGCTGWWSRMWLVLQVKIRASMHAMAQGRVDCILSQFMGDDGVNAERSAFLGTYRGNTCISALPSQCVFPNCRAVQLLHKHNMLTASSWASSVFKPNNTHTKSACSYKSHIPLASQHELYQESLSSGMAVIELHLAQQLLPDTVPLDKEWGLLCYSSPRHLLSVRTLGGCHTWSEQMCYHGSVALATVLMVTNNVRCSRR